MATQGYRLKGITPYYARILSTLRQVAAHSGMIGQWQLLTELGVKRTHNFYRAMEQAQLDGYVIKAYYPTKNGGRAVGYMTNSSALDVRIPFEDFPF